MVIYDEDGWFIVHGEFSLELMVGFSTVSWYVPRCALGMFAGWVCRRWVWRKDEVWGGLLEAVDERWVRLFSRFVPLVKVYSSWSVWNRGCMYRNGFCLIMDGGAYC